MLKSFFASLARATMLTFSPVAKASPQCPQGSASEFIQYADSQVTNIKYHELTEEGMVLLRKAVAKQTNRDTSELKRLIIMTSTDYPDRVMMVFVGVNDCVIPGSGQVILMPGFMAFLEDVGLKPEHFT